MSASPLYRQLASLVDAYHTCTKRDDDRSRAWARHHKEAILRRVHEYLPHGGGFDSGVDLDLDMSTGEKLVFKTSFHHMNETGYYDGWTEHTITVRPSLLFGFTLTIGGRDRNQIKEFIHEAFHEPLGRVFDPANDVRLYQAHPEL